MTSMWSALEETTAGTNVVNLVLTPHACLLPRPISGILWAKLCQGRG